jgi:hypothetical protein
LALAFPSWAQLGERFVAAWVLCLAFLAARIARAEQAVRAVVPCAAAKVDVDGKLGADEYRGALATPVEYFNADRRNRPAQFYYLWDDVAFYVGLRTLDEHPSSQESPLWEGDAVEWYFDVRRNKNFLSPSWPKESTPGAVHCFFTGMHLDKVEPRFTLRPGYDQAIAKTGVEVAAHRTAHGLEVEFKLPWVNFPQFKPAAGEVIGIDAELSYSDGGERSFRTFVFGSPLSVQQPANLTRVRLVERLGPSDWPACAAVMMPIRVDLPWNQEGPLQTVGQIALPPGRRAEIGDIIFQLTDLAGRPLGEYVADREVALADDGDFVLREARWPLEVAPAGNYQVVAIVHGPQRRELARVAPRLVSVNMSPGY